MKATDLLKLQMENTKLMTVPLLEDLTDAPLATPTAEGGNHALWIAGHIVYAEAGLTSHMAFGTPNPLEQWKEVFGRGSEPVQDVAHYPVSIPAIVAKWDEVRANSLAKLEELGEDDLDKESANCAPGREAFFGTIGRVFTATAMHPHMHRGQLADIRRALGRPPLQA